MVVTWGRVSCPNCFVSVRCLTALYRTWFAYRGALFTRAMGHNVLQAEHLLNVMSMADVLVACQIRHAPCTLQTFHFFSHAHCT